MNLRRLDLNLLVIFDALMRERNVTRAARRIALSRPAFSNALSRLRQFLDDELFIRSPEGMLPTPRAMEIAPHVRLALMTLETSLDRSDFDPATAIRTYTPQTNDYLVSTVMSALMRHLAEQELTRRIALTVNHFSVVPALHLGRTPQPEPRRRRAYRPLSRLAPP